MLMDVLTADSLVFKRVESALTIQYGQQDVIRLNYFYNNSYDSSHTQGVTVYLADNAHTIKQQSISPFSDYIILWTLIGVLGGIYSPKPKVITAAYFIKFLVRY